MSETTDRFPFRDAVDAVYAAVDAADRIIRDAAEFTLADGLAATARLDETAREIAALRRRLGNIVGSAMPRGPVTIAGVGTFRRSPRRPPARPVDDDLLWRLVLDHRVVDSVTGEVLPQAEIIRAVYGSASKETGRVRLTGATPGKVEMIGLDPGPLFEYPDRDGWNIDKIG